MLIDEPKIDGYERIVHFADHGVSGYVAIHNTRLGPALGGCRVIPYKSDGDALQDALNLSKGMSYKNSLAGLHFGGGKCVVNAPKTTPEIMDMVGQVVESLDGCYITAEDVGTNIDDMRIIAQRTKYVGSLGAAGDPSPWTALGVFSCIKAVAVYEGLTEIGSDKLWDVWVQGLGKVGWDVATCLHSLGNVRLHVSDLLPERVQSAIETFGASMAENSPEFMHGLDMYVPCAMGQMITDCNYTAMPSIICGSANNQLADDRLAELMKGFGVVYCPDFLVNAAGVMAVAAEIDGFDRDKVTDDISHLGDRLIMVLRVAEDRNITPLAAAKFLAEARW